MSDTEVYRLPPPSPWERSTLDPVVENAVREREHARLEAAVARRQADVAARERAQAQRDLDEGKLALDSYHERSHAAFIVNGGTAADFQAAWPELKRRYLVDRAEAGSPRELAIEKAMRELRSQSSDGF